jgi:DNA-binding NarL/FixJ family response regulator
LRRRGRSGIFVHCDVFLDGAAASRRIAHLSSDPLRGLLRISDLGPNFAAALASRLRRRPKNVTRAAHAEAEFNKAHTMAEWTPEYLKLLLCLPSQLQAEALAALLRARIAGCQIACALRTDQAVSTLASHGPFDLLIWANAEYSPDPGEALHAFRRAQAGVRIAVLAATAEPEQLAPFITDSVAAIVPATTPADIAVGILEVLACGERRMPQPTAEARPAANGARTAKAPPDSIAVSIAILSRRQRDVLQLLSRAESNKAIARLLGVGENTVKTHVKQIMRRLGVKNRTEAALLARRLVAPADGDGGGRA